MKKQYFATWFRLHQVDRYLIWIYKLDYIEDEPEEIVLNERGRIPIFRSESDLAKYATAKNLRIENEEPILHNLDAVEAWLQEPDDQPDCEDCLTAWNLFTDVAYSLKLTFNGDKLSRLRNRIYDKLYWGNNIFVGDPILGHPSGEFYFPEWTPAEISKLTKILRQGFKLFKRYIVEAKIIQASILQDLISNINQN
ncbi:hypothetical protein AHMF7605_01910 [Adhaeribacter arboris]|uniref:Uncharacterized protein n=1 Tax=Adhaeribacter arboris TaxID=2072846 RepID=A0A2T2YA29_9BACT|nr:hypothetical protein [Adhaeribacter arboris]PSR52364.1 hypothetical protein AHMF7605_01910 [Adhaeribacter arboris]